MCIDTKTKESSEPATTVEDEQEPHELCSGIPPWHSFAFIVGLSAVVVPLLPSLEEIDSMSGKEVWTTRKFPELVSLETLAFVRLGIAGISIGLSAYLALIAKGWDVYANYKPRSKLRRVFVRLEGIGTLTPFTSWCWMVLGVGFLLRGIIALAGAKAVQAGGTVAEAAATTTTTTTPEWAEFVLGNKYLLRATLVSWELTGPFAMLVSSAITYSIWPQVKKGGKPHNLAGFRNQLQHNFNSFAALLEVTLLGGISVEFSHLSMAAAYGVVYVVFTWLMGKYYFGNKTVGPQYIYWFMDTTLEKTTTMALVALLFALTLYFAMFSFVVEMFLGSGSDDAGPPSLPANVAFLVAGVYIVCKFWD